MRRAGLLMVAAVLALTGVACDPACKGAKCVGPGITVSIGSKTFRVEVAADAAARGQGLMNRTEVVEGTGMLFLFPRPVRAGFWMKNTLVELDIAFISGDEVIEVRRMTPCRTESCPLTRPSRDYDRALETAAGGLDGVAPGARVTITGALPAVS